MTLLKQNMYDENEELVEKETDIRKRYFEKLLNTEKDYAIEKSK